MISRNNVSLNSITLDKNGDRTSGLYAVLGFDIQSFSTLHDDDQITAIEMLQKWIHQALRYQDVDDGDYIWSPAGDGGFLTFTTVRACRAAVDVAFAVCEKATRPAWTPRNRDRIHIRFGIHAGQIHEGADLGGDKNVWGIGINMTSRILDVSGPSQLLVSRQYHESFIKSQSNEHLEIGAAFYRTMKHGQEIEVINVSRGDICLKINEADALRWQSIGGLWRKTQLEFIHLINDAMRSDDPIAAIAAAKFLLDMGVQKPVDDLCQMIGQCDEPSTDAIYPKRFHKLFSKMEPKTLLEVITRISHKQNERAS